MLSESLVAEIRTTIATTMAGLCRLLENPLCQGEFRHILIQAVVDMFELGLDPNENTMGTFLVITRALEREIVSWTKAHEGGAVVVKAPRLVSTEKRLDLN